MFFPEKKWSTWIGEFSKLVRRILISVFALGTVAVAVFICYETGMIDRCRTIIETCRARRQVPFANVQPNRMFPHYDRPPLPVRVYHDVAGNLVAAVAAG